MPRTPTAPTATRHFKPVKAIPIANTPAIIERMVAPIGPRMSKSSANEFDCDLLVIGAGIHGAAVAREAAARGWNVIVLEQYAEPAVATSSRSSKLIHGGLRYLETGQLKLVYECLREQKILLRTAPQLVHRQRFTIPIAPGMRRPGWLIHAGLWLYCLLGGARPRRHSARYAATDGLLARGDQYLLSYQDAQTDDAPLTAAVLKSAELMGTRLYFQTRVDSLDLEAAGVRIGATHAAGEALTLRARAVANLSGPWVPALLGKVSPSQSMPATELVKGSHIVLPYAPKQGCYYLEAEDGRAVFVMPWRGQRLVGTTETRFTGDPASVMPDEAEIDYLLRTHNRYFVPQFHRSDVLDSWSGLRLLPAGEGSSFKRPRESILLTDRGPSPRLVSLIGGKLTSHRATAEQICRRLAASMPTAHFRADTRRQYLPAVRLPQTAAVPSVPR